MHAPHHNQQCVSMFHILNHCTFFFLLKSRRQPQDGTGKPKQLYFFLQSQSIFVCLRFCSLVCLICLMLFIRLLGRDAAQCCPTHVRKLFQAINSLACITVDLTYVTVPSATSICPSETVSHSQKILRFTARSMTCCRFVRGECKP